MRIENRFFTIGWQYGWKIYESSEPVPVECDHRNGNRDRLKMLVSQGRAQEFAQMYSREEARKIVRLIRKVQS